MQNFEQLFIFIQAIQRDLMWDVCGREQSTSKHFKAYSYFIYLFKLYDLLIIMLLTNDLIRICSEINKIQLIFELPIPAMWKG